MPVLPTFSKLKASSGGTYLLLALLSSAALLVTHLFLPLNVDNDIFQSMGLEIVRHGALPYIGSWAHTLPGMAHCVHAFSIVLFGNSAFGFRVTDVLFHLATVWILFLLLRQWISPMAAALAGFLWTLYYASEGFWLAGQPDGFAVFFIVLATYLYLGHPESTNRSLRLITTGVAMGVAILIRPTYGLFLIALGIVEFLVPSGRKNYLKHLIAILLGTAIPFLVTLTPYHFIRGGLYQLYEATIGFNLDVYSRTRVNYDLRGVTFSCVCAYGSVMLVAWRRSCAFGACLCKMACRVVPCERVWLALCDGEVFCVSFRSDLLLTKHSCGNGSCQACTVCTNAGYTLCDAGTIRCSSIVDVLPTKYTSFYSRRIKTE